MRGQINPSTKVSEVAQKRVSCMSSHGPPRDYYGVLKEHLKTCAKGDKIEGLQLTAWKGQYLLRGRLTLIKSKLSSLLIYFISLFVIPRKVNVRLEKIQKDFF